MGGICPAASRPKACPVRLGWLEAGVPTEPGAGIRNRPPGDLNRMPAATCHSIGIASPDEGNGYSTATPPSGIASAWAAEKYRGTCAIRVQYVHAGTSGSSSRQPSAAQTAPAAGL